jgi:hypothetical protein
VAKIINLLIQDAADIVAIMLVDPPKKSKIPIWSQWWEDASNEKTKEKAFVTA